MNIADVLAPKQLPTIDAARVRTHLLGHDDDIPPKEKPMSRATDVADAIAKLGGRATREDLQAATGLEGKQMENGITTARTAGLVTRDGRDYVLTNGAAPKASKKAAPAKKKPAAKLKQLAAHNAASAAARSVKRAIAAAPVLVADPCPEAYLLRDGGVLIVDSAARIHLTEAQYIAALNPKV